MNSVIARDKDRLDTIFFRHYSDISLFNSFLRLNNALLRVPILPDGQKVLLLDPIKTKSVTKEIQSPLLSDEY